jgi:hypothetical protein
MSAPRILVEGGPADVRTKQLVAAFAGFAVGITVAVIVLFAVAFHAAHDAHVAAKLANRTAMEVAASRREATARKCAEEDERHLQAKHGLEALAVKTEPHTLSRKAGERIINEFTQAVAPFYECKARTQELLRP